MNSKKPSAKSEATNPKSKTLTPQRKTILSGDLFEGEREVVILHGESQYRLQITKAGKLILNK